MKRLSIIAVVLMAVILFVGMAEAACTQAISTQAKGNWLSGLYQKGDTYKAAFYTSTAAWDATTNTYSASNEITGTGYSAGGYTLDSLAFGTSSTTYWLDFADEVNGSVTFDNPSTCLLIYDATDHSGDCTASGEPDPCCTGTGTGCETAVLGVFTFTSVQPSAGTLTITFPTADASNAIIRIARGSWEDQLFTGQLGMSPIFFDKDEVGDVRVSWHRDAEIKLRGISVTSEPGSFGK